MEKSNNISYISLASVISVISVVALHANGCFWDFNPTAGYWASANIIECVFYFAVPVFFMISGATLFDFYDKYDLKTYFKKRFLKTVIPYLFWTCFGIFFTLITKIHTLSDFTPSFIISAFLSGLGIVDVFWFFIPLFCIYLTIPIFALVPKEKRKQIFSYIALAAFVINYLLPFIIGTFKLNIDNAFNLAVVGGYLIYPVIGYLISHHDLKPWMRAVIYALGIAGLLVHILGTYYFSVSAGAIDSTFKGYLNLPCFLYALAAFVLAKYAGSKIMRVGWISKFINFLSKYTFALYLLHWFILTLIALYLPVNTYSLIYRLGIPFVIFAISVLITWLVRKIPVVKRILP